MSNLLDTVRTLVNTVLPPLVGDTYTVTVDPQASSPTTYTGKGTPDDDIERHRERGLTVRDKDRVLILYQDSFSPALSEIQAGDYVTGPSDANNRASESLVVTSVIRDPANATFVVSVSK